jgi:NTP pyrophosphatase (non-canonical NTP hydrolase)
MQGELPMNFNYPTRDEKITLKEYQEFTPTTFIVPEYEVDAVYAYLFSGLAAEGGEVAGNYAKYCRGDFGLDELRNRTSKELGDVMYFVTQLANELGFQLEDILIENKFKLTERMNKNKIFQGW